MHSSSIQLALCIIIYSLQYMCNLQLESFYAIKALTKLFLFVYHFLSCVLPRSLEEMRKFLSLSSSSPRVPNSVPNTVGGKHMPALLSVLLSGRQSPHYVICWRSVYEVRCDCGIQSIYSARYSQDIIHRGGDILKGKLVPSKCKRELRAQHACEGNGRN